MKKISILNTLAVAVAILGLVAAVPLRADNITGGAVTGGTAFTAGGVFDHLSVPFGNVTSPANTVGDNNFKNSPDLFAFAEQSGVDLSANLATQVGTTSIASGTIVNVDYVTFEPGVSSHLIGYVDFTTPVLGIITTDAGLKASNFLGDAGVTYLDPAAVGLEPGDSVTIDKTNPNQIDWNTYASIPGDSVRVITAASPVPEPASILLFGTGLLAGALILKHRLA